MTLLLSLLLLLPPLLFSSPSSRLSLSMLLFLSANTKSIRLCYCAFFLPSLLSSSILFSLLRQMMLATLVHSLSERGRERERERRTTDTTLVSSRARIKLILHSDDATLQASERRPHSEMASRVEWKSDTHEKREERRGKNKKTEKYKVRKENAALRERQTGWVSEFTSLQCVRLLDKWWSWPAWGSSSDWEKGRR